SHELCGHTLIFFSSDVFLLISNKKIPCNSLQKAALPDFYFQHDFAVALSITGHMVNYVHNSIIHNSQNLKTT
ncbi:hypothetical protein STEG23_003837, partial [Scotinomys teguina]